jgi:hypothetical protein
MASEQVNKQKYVVLTIATKLQIVERAENGESISKLAAKFKIGNQTVCDIIKKKDELHKFVTALDTFNGTSNRKSTKCSKFEDLDTAVFNWFKQKRADGHPVSGPLLAEKAIWFHKKKWVSMNHLQHHRGGCKVSSLGTELGNWIFKAKN